MENADGTVDTHILNVYVYMYNCILDTSLFVKCLFLC